jgi:hypothetical protein
MKKIIFIFIVFLFAGIWLSASASAEPFTRNTKHKTVKRMTRAQVRKAQNGHTYYHRVNNKVKRNR